MATIDKTQSQIYNFLIENKTIEDILNQSNITFKEKSRHGGKTFKIIEKNNETNNTLVNNELSENEIFYDALDDLNNISTEKISPTQILTREIGIQTETTEEKRDIANLIKYSYNAITIYDKKQNKKTGIDKFYEEILPIEDNIFFITTSQYIDNSLTEEIICFQQLTNGDIQVVQQIKNYKNINDYKKDILLINDISTNSTNKINNFKFVLIKDYLKNQQNCKLKPNKKEIGIWIISWLIIPLGVVTINLIHPPLLIMSLVIGGIATILRGGAEIFSSKAKKVWSWISNKICNNEELREQNKKVRQLIIKNLTSDKLKTRLKTQYDILKQKLNTRKEKIPDKLINNNTINHNSNNISENLNIKSENNQDFDSISKKSVNNQNPQYPQPSTSTEIYHSNSWL